jgi:hypothetical protein
MPIEFDTYLHWLAKEPEEARAGTFWRAVSRP